MKTSDSSLPPSVLVKHQVKTYGPKFYTEDGTRYRITAKVRYDDQCGNGHNTFSITATIDRNSGGRWENDMGGCCHEEVAKHFPALAPFIKWHLTSSDGPMHYPGNVIYLAGVRDCWGKLKDEPKSWDYVIRWKDFPIDWHSQKQKFIQWCAGVGPEVVGDSEVIAIAHVNRPGDSYNYGDKYTLGGFPCEQWHECPFDSELGALQFVAAAKKGFTVAKIPVAWGEGKERELDSARSCAVWPEATDEELSQEPEQLKAVLMARLPALMVEFKAAVESLGFTY